MNFKLFALLVLAIVLVVCKQSSAGPPGLPDPPSMPDPSSFMPKEIAEHAETAKGFKDMAAGSVPAPESMKPF